MKGGWASLKISFRGMNATEKLKVSLAKQCQHDIICLQTRNTLRKDLLIEKWYGGRVISAG